MSWSPYDTQPQPQPQPMNTPPKSNNTQGFILGLLIVGLAGVLVANQLGIVDFKGDNRSVVVIDDTPSDDSPAPVIDDAKPDPKQDDAPQVDKPALDQTYIVRIYESKNNEGWFADQARNDKFWLIKLPEMGVKLETMDPFSDDGEPNMQATSFVKAAEDRNVDPKQPFWIHAKGGKVLSITPFSKDVGAEQWETIIRNSCKE